MFYFPNVLKTYVVKKHKDIDNSKEKHACFGKDNNEIHIIFLYENLTLLFYLT